VFCANDLLALGFLQGLTTHGLRVPHDIALVGYDDIDFGAAAAVPLSSMRQSREQPGRIAARLLLEESAGNGRHEHRQALLRPELTAAAGTGLDVVTVTPLLAIVCGCVQRDVAPRSGSPPTKRATARARPWVGHHVFMNRRPLARRPSTHQPR
jgi:hypothetical protein